MQARVIGSDAYTCVPPPGFEKDPAVTAAIREFDPGVIPFWRLQAWEIDGAETVFVHHGIARHYPFPRHLRREIRFELPAGWEGPAPNFLDAVFEDQTAMAYLRGEGPGGYVPWGWNIFYWCRWQFDQLTAKVFDAILERRQAREAAAKLAWQREIEYRKKQIEPYLLKQAERLSPSDWKQLQERQHRAAVLRRLGLRPEPIREPKPFIHVRSPRAGETYGRVAPVQE